MNTADDRLRAPVPEGCTTCQHLETWTNLATERHRCLRGFANLQPVCGWHRPKKPGMDAAPWEGDPAG